jgi:hypothetical protein
MPDTPDTEEFERRGVQPAKQLILHDYVPEVGDGSRCARCDTPLKSAYHISVGGERGTHWVCPMCMSHLKSAFGNQFSSRIEH